MNINSLTPHQALQLLLVTSYQYYHRFTSLIEDHEYDALARKLLECYDEWQDHQHSYLLTKEDLKAGTAFAIRREDYPNMVIAASEIWARDKFYKDIQEEG